MSSENYDLLYGFIIFREDASMKNCTSWLLDPLLSQLISVFLISCNSFDRANPELK